MSTPQNSCRAISISVSGRYAPEYSNPESERIRDKIAASKNKGMRMGGNTSLGYKADKRSLIVVPEHAEFCRNLYERYSKLGSVERCSAS